MDKKELIGKLQMVYVGDRNALNELIGYYDGLKQGTEELQQENKKLKEKIKKLQFNLEYEKENLKFRNDYAECLENKLKQRDEVIDKAKELIIDKIEETTYEYIGSNKIIALLELRMDNDSVNKLLDILKEVNK